MKKKILSLLLCLVMALSLIPTVAFAAGMTGDDHITFSSSAPFSISAADKGWNGTVQYSTNNSTWNTWDGSEVSAVSSSGTYYLCFRGTGNSKITGGYTYRWVLDASAGVDCDGNIMTLLNYSSPNSASMAEDCFNSLFYCWNRLTKAPTLPAMTLAPHCYDSLFYNCESLTTAPALPAMTMKVSSYNSMFYGCKNLTAAPALPATTLDSYCYSRMFYACPSLTTAPALPAMTMAYGSYSEMFSGCTGLTAAPALPATSLYRACYSQMFSGCTSLTKAPALPATTLEQSCYEFMFYNCTGLTTAPALPATTLAHACYYGMFENCASLKTAPELKASTVPNIAYQRMFAGCTGLTAVPALPATTLGDYCYKWMFLNCTSINLNTTNARGNGKTWSLPAGAAAKSGWNEDMFMYTKGDLVAPELGTTYYYSDHDHSFVCENTDSQYLKSAADCTNAAVYYKSCECGKRSMWSIFESGAPLGHSYGAWTYLNAAEHQRVCTKNTDHVETAEHSFNSSNVCTACGYEKTVATITVTYDANGGTGTMAPEILELDEDSRVTTYRFPECGFTAPAGKEFDHWEWKEVGKEEWNDATPGSGPWLSDSIIVKAIWRDIPTIASGEGWYLDGNGCLHITGAVVNTSTDEWNGDNTPWKDYKSQIQTVVTTPGASINNGNHLFSSCTQLNSADLSNLNTAAATGMARMFEDCYRMTFLNVSGFNTANVTNMASMFSNCSDLTALDVSSFNTANVESMNSMFGYCGKLTSLDLSGFNTAKVESTAGMFVYCSALTFLDIRNFQITWDTDISNMFIGCAALNKIHTNHSVLERTADSLIDISPTWTNADSGAVYADVDALQAIPGTVTLLKGGVPVTPTVLKGDVNGDDEVTDADAVYLLYYTFFGDESYPVNQPCDFNGDGEVTDADAVYLLYYTFFGEESYPLH